MILQYWCTYGGFHKLAIPLNIIQFNGIVHYKPTFWGYIDGNPHISSQISQRAPRARVLVGALHRPVPFKMLRRQGIQVTTLVVAVASLEFAGVQILERQGNTGDDHKKIWIHKNPIEWLRFGTIETGNRESLQV